jgi:hypothetical protein
VQTLTDFTRLSDWKNVTLGCDGRAESYEPELLNQSGFALWNSQSGNDTIAMKFGLNGHRKYSLLPDPFITHSPKCQSFDDEQADNYPCECATH